MKAIETKYKGYRFRSRLEARYAVFFDALGIRWDYEAEGYDLGKFGWYLPDFYLPELHAWVEIKGGAASEKEINKCLALFGGKCEKSVATDLIALADMEVTWGILGNISAMADSVSDKQNIVSEVCSKVRNKEKVYLFEGLLDSGWLMTSSGAVKADPLNALWFLAQASKPVMRDALISARSARFEYGERG